MGDKEDYLTSYRMFFENFAATVNPEDQLPVNIAGYTITEAELPGEVLYWTTQYLTEKQCPVTLMTPLQRIILDEVQVASKKQPNDFGYKADEAVYIALRLMQAVTARVNAVCLRYLDNSQLDTLPPPPAQPALQTVSIAAKNSRRVMEDRHVEIGNLEALFGIETTEPTSFYAVYDGHAGSAAAMYCAAHLHQYLAESPLFSTDLRRAMKEAFLRTDAEFVRKSNQERTSSGSTAVCVCVRGQKLVAAWAGDSLALLAKRMRLMQLVRPHKPSRQDERERIESSGGTVMYWGTWRVNGQLAVSRAIGDAQYKPYVTARPELATVELDGDEDFVVVACDGLWDFVSEDDVALAVYRQLAADPDDLKAVTKRLVVQAKRQGSADNISIIVVFLKDPRDIAADNRPPMDLGLDNALANAPPFVMESEACKRLEGAAGAEAEGAGADNGVDNSDSDSEDLGPETAVDADDIDADRHEPQPPTPPAHDVEANHIDGGLVDNVAESGEESEDEWNYFKGEGEREHREETDEPPRSDTPGQDNSAWETSSVDMNSSPLNPDAPVFVPGGAGGPGGDVLLAESPRKPLPMDDIELPDVAQFRTEATGRPAELLDLDNCDHLNGHHNVSIDEAVKEQMNGNEKCTMDSLGFGFNVGVEPEKVNDTGLIQDFERIQKDTTDFCNIQVFQAHTETNPFATESNDELFERLKNKERDPMSMSFYQEKDDDTCVDRVDLNAVQPLPDSDEDEANTNTNGLHEDKENIRPHADLLGLDPTNEPNNDIIRFDDRTNDAPNFADNFAEYNATNNMQNYNMDFESSNVPEDVAHTDTPESHKLLFEQIPEIPDGKSSELGFTNDDALDPESERDRATPQEEMSQDVDMESKMDDSPEETQSKLSPEPVLEEHNDIGHVNEREDVPTPVDNAMNEIISESEFKPQEVAESELKPHEATDFLTPSPAPVNDISAAATTPEAHDVQQNIIADVHSAQDSQFDDNFDVNERDDIHEEADVPIPEIHFETSAPVAESPMPAASPLPAQSPLPTESPLPAKSPLPVESPMPVESPVPVQSIPVESPMPVASPMPADSPLPKSPLPSESPAPIRSPTPAKSPAPSHHEEIPPSPFPTEPLPQSPPPLEPQEPSAPAEVPLPSESPAPVEFENRLAPEASEPSGPAPDIVPEQRSELITDIDIGIPESRAQEICVPVTSEINDELSSATPPPTPAAPLNDTPIAGDIQPEQKQEDTQKLGETVAVAAATAAVAATAAAASKTKTPASATKKSPTTPKPDSRTPKSAPTKPSTTRTPISAKKPAATTTPAAKSPAVTKTTPARTPLSAARPTSAAKPASKPSTPAAKPAPITKPAPAKSSPAAAKPAPSSRLSAKPAPKEVKEAPAVQKPPPISRAGAAASRAALAKRPATAGTTGTAAASKPATTTARPATARPAAPRPRPLDKKPLTNGDVKPAARPAPRAAPAARPAPRPTPRTQPAAPAAATAAPPKSTVPKPAPRAALSRPPVKDADKQSKDLANRRITAKAPPRTAPAKAPVGTKSVPVKTAVKKPIDAAKKPAAAVPNGESNGLTNGSDTLAKPPPSPPATHDNALLPDVIA